MKWFKNLIGKEEPAAKYEITDDSGFLAVIDPDAYAGFVQVDWTFQILQEHFKREMQKGHLLIWATGMEHVWRVAVSMGPTKTTGFREVIGSINCTKGRLLLTSYDSLTMAAQFADTRLPQNHEQDQVIQVSPALYSCRIIQLSDPHTSRPFNEKTNFVYEITPTTTPREGWKDIPWSTA